MEVLIIEIKIILSQKIQSGLWYFLCIVNEFKNYHVRLG